MLWTVLSLCVALLHLQSVAICGQTVWVSLVPDATAYQWVAQSKHDICLQCAQPVHSPHHLTGVIYQRTLICKEAGCLQFLIYCLSRQILRRVLHTATHLPIYISDGGCSHGALRLEAPDPEHVCGCFAAALVLFGILMVTAWSDHM